LLKQHPSQAEAAGAVQLSALLVHWLTVKAKRPNPDGHDMPRLLLAAHHHLGGV
jgi:hypothetical protein